MAKKEISTDDIVSIARQAGNVYNFFTRNDMAWQLEVPDDSELVRSIHKAYELTKDPALKKLVSNDGIANLMDNTMALILAEDGKFSDLNEIASITSLEVKDKVKAVTKSINKVNSIIKNGGNGDSDFSDFLKGQVRAKDIKSDAMQLQQDSQVLVEGYTNLVDQIRALSDDFVLLRNQVEVTYRKFASILIDVYGDRVQQIQPELFDFNSIEYLDSEHMLQDILMGLENIIGAGDSTVQAIGDSFSNTTRTISDNFLNTKDTSTAIGMSLFDAFDHYSKAATMTNEFERSYSVFRQNLSKTVGDIGSDTMRISRIGSTINSVFIPHALLFIRYANGLMDKEFCKLLDSMYGQPATAELKAKRDELLKSYLELQNSISDHEVNADLCRRNSNSVIPEVQKLQAKLDTDKAGFKGADGDEEFNKGYIDRLKRRAHELYQAMAQMNIYRGAENQHYQMAESDRKKLAKTKRLLAENASQMTGKLSITEADYATMARHLRDIICLLKQAKDILQSGFGDDLVKPAYLTEAVTMPEISAEMEGKINNFIHQKFATLNGEPSQPEMIEGPDGQLVARELTPEEQSEAEMDARMGAALESAAELVHSSVMLGYQLAREQVAIADYKRQMAANKALFEAEMEKVNNRAALIEAVTRKAAEAGDDKTVKDAILLLTEIDPESVSDEKMIDFVKGNGTITI